MLHTVGEGDLHAPHEVEEVLRLLAEGRSDGQVAEATGIPHRTINHWRSGRLPVSYTGAGGPRPGASCPRCHGRPLDEAAYSYLLGLYLGDGHITHGPRADRLSIVQDGRYPGLITLARHAILRVRDGQGIVGTVQRVGCVVVCAWWQHWPCVFPQHGPGRKHHRPIVLEDWQEAVVDRYPRQLLRGLVHSDGCRSMNRVRGGRYAYPRYFFSNRSNDILRIFCEACRTVGVRYRMSSPVVVSIARRDDVARLDAFIGPKA